MVIIIRKTVLSVALPPRFSWCSSAHRGRVDPRTAILYLFGLLLGAIISFESQRQSLLTCDEIAAFGEAAGEASESSLAEAKRSMDYDSTSASGMKTSTSVPALATGIVSGAEAAYYPFGIMNIQEGRFVTSAKPVRSAATSFDTSVRDVPKIWESLKRDFASEDGRTRRAVMTEMSLPPVVLYVLVKSAPRNYVKRQSCRSAWQWRNAGRAFIPGLLSQSFVVGRAVGGKDVDKVNHGVLAERKRFGDIVVYPGNDTYRRLTWKVLWGLQYAVKTYDFDMLLFCDDDSFINYPQLFKWIGGQVAKGIYAGHPNLNGQPQRGKRGEHWPVTLEDWPGDYYPPYCLGGGYIMTRDVVNASLAESLHHRIFWIEDVFVGYLVQKTRLVQRPVRILFYYALPSMCCWPSPLFLGSRTRREIAILGQRQRKQEPLC